VKNNNKKYNRIKITLVEQERSSKWLAEKIDKDKSTVSRWCTNDMQPSIETLFQISEILNVSVKDLLNEKPNA
jgi:transcriptional regulator with XRE-family HTH domain